MLSKLLKRLHLTAVLPELTYRRRHVWKHLQQLTPIADIEPQDIVLASYPRSGVTWMQNLVAGLLYGVCPELTPNSVIQHLVPDVHQTQFYRRHQATCFLKSHLGPQPNYRRVVHLVRDGRDVIVSHRHFLSAVEQREVDFGELIGPRATVWPCKWHEHTEAWESNPYGAEVLLLRYEDLRADTVGSLRRLCEFAGLEREHAFLQRTAEGARFDRLQRQEGRFGQGGYANGARFYRRGVAGSYRDELPPEVLAVFLAEAEPTLRKHGYLEAAAPGRRMTG
jgi:hypothetical protein